MDKFSGISLFDFFSFFIPGFLLELAICIVFTMAGVHLPFDFSLFTGNEALIVLSVSVMAYLLGHAVHYFGAKAKWLGTGKLQQQITGFSLLKKEAFLAQQLNNKSKHFFDFGFLNEKNELLKQETERFFNISFRLLEQKNLLLTSRYLQIQYKLFINVFVTAFTGIVISVFAIIYILIKEPSKQPVPYLFAFILLLVVVASVSYQIAAERRVNFIKTVWWQFYAFYFAPKEKPLQYEQQFQ